LLSFKSTNEKTKWRRVVAGDAFVGHSADLRAVVRCRGRGRRAVNLMYSVSFWVGVSGFGRIRWRVGFRAAPQGKFAVCMGILTLQKWIPDSVEGRIRADSWTPELESANPGLITTMRYFTYIVLVALIEPRNPRHSHGKH